MKKQDDELWMKKMKEMLSEYAEPVPAKGWEALEKELRPAPKRVYTIRWRAFSAAAALLLAISAVSLFFLNTDTAEELRHVSAEIASTTDQLPTLPQVDILKPVPHPVQANGVALKEVGQSAGVVAIQMIEESEEVSLAEPQEIVEENAELTEEIATVEEKIVETALEEQPKEREVVRPSGKDKLHLPAENTSKKDDTRGWSLAANMNSGMLSGSQSGGSMSKGRFDLLQMSHDVLSEGIVNIPPDQVLVFENGMPYLLRKKDITSIKHNQPVSVGLSVRKGLKNNFSVETGVTYTQLSSEIRIKGEEEEKYDQKLHYVGIPVKLNWDFIDAKRFNLYVSAGGAVERCVYGKVGGKKETINELQFSLLGTVGAQYKATDKIGLYIEPGVAYFFDDGSKVETIRKDKPFNVNIQAGIRLTY